MTTDVYRFEFDDRDARGGGNDAAPCTRSKACSALARVRMDAGYHVDEPRAITIDGTTEVGATLVQVFTSPGSTPSSGRGLPRAAALTAAEGRAA